MVLFLLITFFCSHISVKNKLHAHTLHTYLTFSAFMTSACNLPGRGKKTKKVAVKLVSTKRKYFHKHLHTHVQYVQPFCPDGNISQYNLALKLNLPK